MDRLSVEQRRAVESAVAGDTVFITGGAGVGKSVVVQELANQLRRVGKKVALTAPTGVGAVNVGGRTTHSWFGQGLAQDAVADLVARARKIPMLKKRLLKTQAGPLPIVTPCCTR